MYSHVRSEHASFAKDNWSACPFCERLLPSKESIGAHFQQCKSNKFYTLSYPELMVCSQCKKGTVSFKHMNFVHKEFVEGSWMICASCEIYFPDEDLLAKHWNVCEALSLQEVKNCQVILTFIVSDFLRQIDMYHS